MNLKQNIRKVLREEQYSKLKEFISNSINRIGIEKTQKKTGLSITKLVEISDVKIDGFIAKMLIFENLKNGKLTNKFGDFKIVINNFHEDAISWESIKNLASQKDLQGTLHMQVLATPYTNGMKSTPIELEWCGFFTIEKGLTFEFYNESDFNDYTLFPNPKSFETIDEVFEWYELDYLYQVEKIITQNFIPKAIEKIKDEVK